MIGRFTPITLLVVLILAGSPIVTAQTQSELDKEQLHIQASSGISWNDKMYELYAGSFTWEEAKEFAIRKGGHLATITSAEEQDVVSDLVSSFGKACWLGGYYKDDEWKWLTDEAFIYTNWDIGEPSGEENHLGIYGDSSQTKWATNKRWNDFKNISETPKGLVIEYPLSNVSIANIKPNSDNSAAEHSPQKPTLNLKNESFDMAQPFREGVALVGFTDYSGPTTAYCIDTKGDVLFTFKNEYLLPYDSDETIRAKGFVNGIAQVRGKSRYIKEIILIDKQGEIVVSRNKLGVDDVLSVYLEDGYVLVFDIKPEFTGDIYRIGLLDTQGNWLMPLSGDFSSQIDVKALVNSIIPSVLYEGKILFKTYPTSFLLDVQSLKFSNIDYDTVAHFGNIDWRISKDWEINNSRQKAYLHADGSIALAIDEIYPTFAAGKNFVGEYAAVTFSTDTARFFGVIDKKGKLLFDPIQLKSSTIDDGYGVLDSSSAYYTSANKLHLIDLSGKDILVIDDAHHISPFSGGLARVTRARMGTFGPWYEYYYINEDGTKVIGQ